MNGERFFYMLPKMIIDISDMRDLLIAEDIEFTVAEQRLQELVDNSYINTIVDMAAIQRYEKIFGVKTIGDIDIRKSMLMAKLRGSGATTEALVKNVTESFTYGEVEVVQDYPNYTVKIRFVGEKGIPSNLEAVKQSLNQIIPAHLAIEYIFTYMTWDEFDRHNNTWNEWDALNLTWDEFEKYNGS